MREARGWSQAELARISGVPRATVSAVETGRTVPSVQIALQLAQALETTVETLFASPGDPLQWAWPPPEGPVRFIAARIQSRAWAYPAEPFLAAPAHDGVVRSWASLPQIRPELLRNTLVIATCDPAISLLASDLSARGVRLLALERTSALALDLLARGLVHVAGAHWATTKEPNLNRAQSNPDTQWTSVQHWEMGLAVTTAFRRRSVPDLIRQDIRWINRPPGSGARACIDRLFAQHRSDRPPPPGFGQEARDHRAVAEILTSGFADVGVVMRCIAEEHRLAFRPIETQIYELATLSSNKDDHRIAALMDVIRSKDYRQALTDIPGLSPFD